MKNKDNAEKTVPAISGMLKDLEFLLSILSFMVIIYRPRRAKPNIDTIIDIAMQTSDAIKEKISKPAIFAPVNFCLPVFAIRVLFE
jgi:hypothetical protein